MRDVQMNETTHIPLVITAFLILVLFAAVAPAQAASCGPCDVAQERCSANCFGLEEKAESVTCLIACDNAAATCSCAEEVTLRSEDVVANNWLRVAEPSRLIAESSACHSTTPCGSAYPSCASWSGYFDCGDPYCGINRWCGDVETCPDPEFGCWGPALRQWRERFRVCFNAIGWWCTEYQRTSHTLGCGC